MPMSSRAPSRSGTPLPSHHASPSRLGVVPPVLHQAPSLSNLRVYSHNASAVTSPVISPTPLSHTPLSVTPPASSMLASGTTSSAASVNFDAPTEGILVPDPEAEVEVAEGEAVGRVEEVADEEMKKQLREQLRRTLSAKHAEVHSNVASRRPSTSRHRSNASKTTQEVHELSHTPDPTNYPPRQYFVLTDAGKPVFISPDADPDHSTSIIGLMQALISVFIDDRDKIRCINAGRTRIVFLLRTPLYYACVSSWGEPESVTRFHLEYLHLQILSVVSAEQLRRMFERRNNFDLRRLLAGAEPFMYSLLSRLEFDLAMSTSSLQCLKLDPGLRKRIADTLVPTSKIKNILYVVLVAQGRVITLVRPKKHSIHPSDLHILINTVHSPSIINSSAAASWLPICLPKFNPGAFVNAYVSFLRRGDDHQQPQAPVTPTPGATATTSQTDTSPEGASQTEGAAATESTGAQTGLSESTASDSNEQPAEEALMDEHSGHVDIGLVCVSGLADFEAVRGWCATASEKLERENLLSTLVSAITSGATEYSVGDLSIPGLRHFVYKSRGAVQVTAPRYEEPYATPRARRRLVTLYQTLHDALHAKSGQGGTLKMQYVRTERESVMGWITQPFELYIAMSPLMPKSAVVNAANAIARWVQREEKRLFLRDAPVF
ncbi:trafficking protein Mon1-domain-containing protein [Phanerochaete sordida]|uniref:Vacuolar fusion protein MON1 n=1 Tax=Phanerochaete sordida TaxID=48140 RepID=A0A9P3L8Q2_9APHY|nr:trafficking protein Mon1-domain-containing protein [Phanerochaete sordida]